MEYLINNYYREKGFDKMIMNSHIFVLFICSLTKKGDLPAR